MSSLHVQMFAVPPLAGTLSRPLTAGRRRRADAEAMSKARRATSVMMMKMDDDDDDDGLIVRSPPSLALADTYLPPTTVGRRSLHCRRQRKKGSWGWILPMSSPSGVVLLAAGNRTLSMFIIMVRAVAYAECPPPPSKEGPCRYS